MQTKQQIQQLLAAAAVSPNKRLGQHFLIDLNLMRLLVDSANMGPSDVVLEVGCGTGSLTEALGPRAGRVIAVEVDRTLADITRDQLAGSENVDIINTDILENKSALNSTVVKAIDQARQECPGQLLLVANLPYNVAAPVVLNLAAGPLVADSMCVTVQKEVADRMTAAPGGKDYGSLSILLSATGEVKTIRTLKPTVFWPRPQVDSAMVSFVRQNEKASRIENMALFGETVSFFMGHRRKMLRTCGKLARAKPGYVDLWPRVFEQCSINSTRRPAELPPEDYIVMANAYRKIKTQTHRGQ